MRASLSRGAWAYVPAAAIVIPAALLALLGWRAYRADALLLEQRYRKDQLAMLRLVGTRLSEEARKAIADLAARCRDRRPNEALEARFIAAHPLARHIFVVRGGRLLYPAPAPALVLDERSSDPSGPLLLDTDVRRYIQRMRQRRRLRVAVARGLRAEYAGRLKEAKRIYRRVARERASAAAAALLGLARIGRALGQPQEAIAAYRGLRRRFAELRGPEQVSYALLADVGMVDLGERVALRVHRELMAGRYPTSAASRRYYLRWIIERLAKGRGGAAALGAATLDRLRNRTEALFASYRFERLLQRSGIAERQIPGREASALFVDSRTVVLLQRQPKAGLIGFALSEGELARRVADQQRRLQSSGRWLSLTLYRAGQGPSARHAVSSHTIALDAPLSHWRLLASYSPKVAGEPRQRRRHFGMVFGLLLVLAAGLLMTYRGVRRERDLAQLKSDFASNVSHELKTPLTSIRMYAEMLQQGIADDAADQARYHEVIIRESERLGRLIANVLDFSRVERGTRRYDLVAEDPYDLADDAVRTHLRLSDGVSGQVSLEGRAGILPAVTADREAAVQSILNLLSNATKYSVARSEIAVRLVRAAGRVGVQVEDQGIGIPLGEQKRIFDDFYRAPGARQVGVEGTGLGLALVKRHMAAFGGSVEVNSAVGRGSRFTLWFSEAPTGQEVELVHDTGH